MTAVRPTSARPVQVSDASDYTQRYTSTTTLRNSLTADPFDVSDTRLGTGGGVRKAITMSSTKVSHFLTDSSDLDEKLDLLDSQLVRIDKPILYSLYAVGTLSGPRLFIKSNALQLCLTMIQIVLCVILLAGLVTGLLFSWDAKEDSALDKLVRTLATIILNGWLALQAVIFLALSHMKCGLIKYYEQLALVEKSLVQLGVRIRMKRIRWFIRVVVVIIWLFCLGNCGVRVIDFKDEDYDDAMLGTKTENNATKIQVDMLKGLGRTALTIVTIHWAFGQAYFVIICVILWTLLADYNRTLEKDIKASPKSVFENLEEYRKTHLDLCDLVEQADTIFKWNFGVLIGANTLILLCILYLASVSINNPELYDFGRYFYYIVMAGAALVVIIFFCDRVHNETTEGYKTIQRVIQTEEPVTNLQIYQMQLFQERIKTPEPLTAAGLLDINKELGMTLVGIIVSYYLVMVQFNSIPDENQVSSCSCNTTTS